KSGEAGQKITLQNTPQARFSPLGASQVMLTSRLSAGQVSGARDILDSVGRWSRLEPTTGGTALQWSIPAATRSILSGRPALPRDVRQAHTQRRGTRGQKSPWDLRPRPSAATAPHRHHAREISGRDRDRSSRPTERDLEARCAPPCGSTQ